MKKQPDYQCVDCAIYDEYERLAIQRKTVTLTIQNGDSTTELQSKIKTLKTEKKVEYMILESGERIRLDWVLSWVEG